MNREHVLAIILVISLCANGYLIFTDHSSLDKIQEIKNTVLPETGIYPNSTLLNNTSPNDIAEKSAIDNDVQVIIDAVLPETDTSMNISPDSVFLNTTSPNNNSGEKSANQTHITSTTLEDGSGVLQNETDPETTIGTLAPTPTPDVWTTYSSKKYAFSVRYPTTWDVNDGSTGSPGMLLALTAPPEMECDPISAQCFKYIASMTIEIDQDPETLSLEEYFNSAVASLQKDYAITSTSKSASCMLSGNRAYQIEFYTRDERGNPDRSYMQYYTLIDKKGYIISYTGPYSTWENVFNINKGDAQRIIDSFEVQRTYEVV